MGIRWTNPSAVCPHCRRIVKLRRNATLTDWRFWTHGPPTNRCAGTDELFHATPSPGVTVNRRERT